MAVIQVKNGEISSSAGIDLKINSTSSLFVSEDKIAVNSKYVSLTETNTAPPLPDLGKGTLYVSGSDSKIYFKNDVGNVYDLTATANLSGNQVLELPSLYDREIHVSALSGNDSTGNGTSLKPYATITKAFSVVNNGGQQIVVHPGTYRENATLTALNVTVCAAQGSNGGEVFISGTITISGQQSSTRLYGLSLIGVTHYGSGSLYVDTCQIDNFNKTANAYCYINDSDISYNCTLSGSGIFSINGGHISQLGTFQVVGSDVTASVKNCLNLTYPVVNGGYLGIEGTSIFATSSGGYALSASATSIIDLINCYCSDINGLAAPVYMAGASGYANTVFNKANSYILSDTISAYGLNRTPIFENLNSNVLTVGASSKTTAAANSPIINIKNYEWVGTGTVNTTSATVTTLATIATNSSTGYFIEADIIGRQTNGTNQTNIYKVAYRAKNNAGTITGAATQMLVSEEVAAWDSTITASGTNILIRVTGATSTNITWKCIYRVREI